MPSRRRRRRRQKRWVRPIEPAPWLWGALALNLVVGLVFSPATAMSHLRIVGAQPYDRDRLADIAERIQHRPLLRVNGQAVQSEALENTAVVSASYRANLFGRGVLTVRYRRPVAAIVGRERLYLSDRGTIFSSPHDFALTMSVDPPIDVDEENLAVFSGWQGGAAARMCVSITELLPRSEWLLKVSPTGYVRLESDGGVVEFGSFDKSEQKVRKLADILSDDPDMLSSVTSLNLSEPTEPSYVPKK
ncbi:MAG: hypothetical protein IH945_11705 [Armatimonadetes bacterium]|nr:hypothetical protein [Armatimonadota bacterium]